MAIAARAGDRATRLVAERGRPTVPVVLITAFGGEKMAGEAFRLGAARYREKPFPLRAPVEAVKTAARGEEREAPA